MGQPVVHFEVIGKDGEELRRYYTDLFGWEIEWNAQFGYGTVPQYQRADGKGIGGGVGTAPPGYGGHVTFYVEVPDVEEALQKAESLGGKRMMGPDKVIESVTIGQFTDPEGHLIGLLEAVS